MASASGRHHVPATSGQRENFYLKKHSTKGLCLVYHNDIDDGTDDVVLKQNQMIFIMCAMKEVKLGPDKTRDLCLKWEGFVVSSSDVEEIVAHIEDIFETEDRNSDPWKNCWSHVERLYKSQNWVDYFEDSAKEHEKTNSNTSSEGGRY